MIFAFVITRIGEETSGLKHRLTRTRMGMLVVIAELWEVACSSSLHGFLTTIVWPNFTPHPFKHKARTKDDTQVDIMQIICPYSYIT